MATTAVLSLLLLNQAILHRPAVAGTWARTASWFSVSEPADPAGHADTAFRLFIFVKKVLASNVGNNDRGNTMIKFSNQLKLFLPAASSIAFLVSFSVIAEAAPNCTGGCLTGVKACTDWCMAHNKTNNSQLQCLNRCSDYWLNGKNPQSLGFPPTNPTNGTVGPGRLKDPPTTVSDPTPPRRPVTTAKPTAPFKPVGNSNPNGPHSGTSNPVIFERKNGVSQSGGHDSGGGGHGK